MVKRNVFQQTMQGLRVHFPVTASLVAGKPLDVPVRKIGKPFTGEVAVKRLSCLLVLAALVACSGSNGDSSTQPPALAFAAACQGTTANQFTQRPAFAPSLFLSDNGPVQGSIQVPPSSGPLGYNSFTPSLLVGFPAVGGTYTDRVLGGTIRRLTDTVGRPNLEDIYAHHWANANGSLAFSRTLDINGITFFNIIDTTTGQPRYTDLPRGSSPTDIAWDATDPNRYYYYEGATLTCWNLAEKRKVTKTFPSPLERNGGSLNTQDRSGRYFTVRYGGSNKVWDSQTDTIYSGSVTPLNLNGWVAITPDGKHLVTAAGPNSEHYSYAIDHINHSISPNPVNFWTACQTDHGVLTSATNGKNYFTTFDCNNSAGIYRVDITLDQTGKTEPEQIAANQLLLPTVFSPVDTNQGHLSAVSKKGLNQDWVFFDSETLGGDPFNSDPTFSPPPLFPWQPYEQEIVAMNVTTLEVRRYAHHRSRGIDSDYHAQPRISCSWDGSIILWTSNYNTPLPHLDQNGNPLGHQNDYADMYGMAFSH